MERAPQANGAERAFGICGERTMGKVAVQFIGIHVNISEDDDAGGRLFQYLRTPAGVVTRMKAFAAVKAKRLEGRDQRGKTGA